MYLTKIKKIINKFINKKNNSRKKPKKNKLILKRMEQTTFIKKRKYIKFNNIDFKRLHFIPKNYYLYLILFIFTIAIIYSIVSSTFKIKFIEIIKQDNITNMTIAYKATDKFRGKSILNINKKNILKNLIEYQHNIKDINLHISLPNTLKININSYKALFNTTINDKSYLLTENGVLIPHNSSEQLKELKIIKKFDKNIFLDYKKIFNEKFINNILFIKEKIKENIIDLNISEMTYYVRERELHIKIDKNTILIFNLNSDIKEQIEKLSIFNKDHVNINKNTIIYIDLRIKNKVFYCTTEKEYQCYKNLKSVYSKE